MKKLDMPSLSKANEVLEKILKVADANKLNYTFEASNELVIDFNSLIGTVRLIEEKEKEPVANEPKKARGRPPKKAQPLPAADKNLVMIKRVIRSRDTKDPAEIAEVITSNSGIKSQTTFSSIADVLGFIDKYKSQVFGK